MAPAHAAAIVMTNPEITCSPKCRPPNHILADRIRRQRRAVGGFILSAATSDRTDTAPNAYPQSLRDSRCGQACLAQPGIRHCRQKQRDRDRAGD